MIAYTDPDHLTKTLAFAASVGAADKLIKRLNYLANYSDGKNTAHVYKDWAPHSFAFVILRPDGTVWFNGGLIYQGPGQPGDGSAPALTVNLSPDPSLHSWGVHT